jgi:cytochrome c553
MNIHHVLISLVLLFASAGASADPEDAARVPGGLGSKDYVWNKMTREQADILRLTGDAIRGKTAFTGCRGCHKSDGSGRPDGTYPRLTGQHAIVVIKQVTDTRAGLRENQKMLPFATEHAISLQEISDIAQYLAGVQTQAENGKGPGNNIERGKKAYISNGCDSCHGVAGEGNERKAYPVIAAQHYEYALREMQHVRDGSRANGHPEMSKLLKTMSTVDMEAIADYVSRLPDYRRNTVSGQK